MKNSNVMTPCTAIMAALERIEANKGQEGFRKPFDLAMKIKGEIEWAGFKIVIDPKGPLGTKAVEARLASERRIVACSNPPEHGAQAPGLPEGCTTRTLKLSGTMVYGGDRCGEDIYDHSNE